MVTQVEYAMEAVNQGNCLLGLRSATHVVQVGLRTQVHELAYPQEKLFSVSSHMGIGVAGLTPDGLLLHKYMKNQCLNYNFVYNSNYPVEKLVEKIAESKGLS